MQPSIRYLIPLGLILSLTVGCATHAPAPSGDGHASVAQPDSVRADVVRSVRAMVGAPYRYGGRSPRGFDCSGLVWYSHRQAGIAVPRTAAQQFAAVQRKRADRLQPGDLVFFADRHGRVFHVGTYVGRGRFVHAPSSGKAVVTSELSEPYWKHHLAGAGSFF